MKKILFLLHLPPPHHGASTVGLQIKKSEKLKNSFSTSFINIGTSKKLNNNVLSSSLWFVRNFVSAFLITASYRPDLVYYTPSTIGLAFFKDFFLIKTLQKLFKKKFVLHFHNKGMHTKKGVLINYFYKSLLNKNHIILLSEKLSFELKKTVSTDKIHYCNNGIYKTNPDLINNPIYKYDFLFLSNLIKEKGIIDYIYACGELKSSGYNGFTAAIVGQERDIKYKKINQLIIELNLENNLFILGPLFGKDKRNVFLNSKIFVFPTYYHFECFPLVLLEAISFGNPIISTREGAISDILKENINGLFCEPKNHLNLALKMKELYVDKSKYLKFRKEAFKTYKENFTEDHFIDRFQEILKNILNE